MGWCTTERPRDVKQYFKDGLTWESEDSVHVCLDIALKLNVLYAAVETRKKESGETRVWCSVMLIRYYKNPSDGYNFGYKDMTENDLPNEVSCPKKILDLLTPTSNKLANEWRKLCRERLSRIVKKGDSILFDESVNFNGEPVGRRFEVVMVQTGKRKSKRLQGSNGRYYSMDCLALRKDWVKVTEPDVSKNQSAAEDWFKGLGHERSVRF